MFSIFQAVNQPAEHAGDFFELCFEGGVVFRGQQFSAKGKFQERNAFLQRTSRDAEEVFSVGYGEAAVAFGDVEIGRAHV